MADLFAPGLVTDARRAGPHLSRAVRHQNERMARRLRTTRGGGVTVTRPSQRELSTEAVVALDSDSAVEDCVPSLLMAAFAVSPPPKLKKTRKLRSLRDLRRRDEEEDDDRGENDVHLQDNKLASIHPPSRLAQRGPLQRKADADLLRKDELRAPLVRRRSGSKKRAVRSRRRESENESFSPPISRSPVPSSPSRSKSGQSRLAPLLATVTPSKQPASEPKKEWEENQDAILLREVSKYGGDLDSVDWEKISTQFPPATADECREHHWEIFIANFNASATASAVKKGAACKAPGEEFNRKDPTKGWKMLSELNRRALCKKSHDIFEVLDGPKEGEVRSGRRSWGLSSLMSDFANSASPAPVSPTAPVGLSELIGEVISAEPDTLIESRFQEKHRKQQMRCRLRVSLSQDESHVLGGQLLPVKAVTKMLKREERPRFARRRSLEVELDNAENEEDRKLVLMELAHATQDDEEDEL